jgi:hypothetical protein
VLAVYFLARFDSHPVGRLDPHTLELNCIVQGDDTDHVFTVNVARTKNVSALRKAIKEENEHAFEQVDAKTLNLWKVSAHRQYLLTPH